jgi:hypothetical protein
VQSANHRFHSNRHSPEDDKTSLNLAYLGRGEQWVKIRIPWSAPEEADGLG